MVRGTGRAATALVSASGKGIAILLAQTAEDLQQLPGGVVGKNRDLLNRLSNQGLLWRNRSMGPGYPAITTKSFRWSSIP